jgi:hypothetical protein
LFKILGVVLRPPLDAKPRCHADGAADECDCDKSGFEFGSNVAFPRRQCTAVPYNPNLGSVRILSLFNLKFSKKIAPIGIVVSGYADLLKPPNVAALHDGNEIAGLLNAAGQNRQNGFLIDGNRLLDSRCQLGGPRASRFLGDLTPLMRQSTGSQERSRRRNHKPNK